MKRYIPPLLPALAAVLAPLTVGAQTLQFGNLNVIQFSFENAAENVAVTIAPGSTTGISTRANTNRGDYALSFGNEDDPAVGVLISSVRQNGRDDSATGNTISVPFYATSATFVDNSGYWIGLAHASNGGEVNMNLSFGFFPYSTYLAGFAQNSADNGQLNSITGSPGIDIGSGQEFQNTGTAGQYTLNLTGLGGSSASGILLVTGGKNEDNYALSRPNANGTFTIFCKDNGSNGTSYEADPVGFVYLPVSGAGRNQLVALGRVNNDGSTDVAGGTFTVTKASAGRWYLTIPEESESTGVLLVSPEWGGNGSGGSGNMSDNIVSAQWDEANRRWVIESRDITNSTTQPVLQDGVNAAEDVFSFAFFTTGNDAPTVVLDAPTAGSSTMYPAPFEFQATASDGDGSVARVEFLVDGVKVGEDADAPYALSWRPPAAGNYEVVARAIDNLGTPATSAAATLQVTPNPNPAPQAVVTAPANNTTGIGTSTTLQLTVTDADATTVTFYGRKTVPATPGPDFVLGTLPDTQFYSENIDGTRAETFHQQTRWFVDQRESQNLVFVSHMGDMVQHGDNGDDDSEWNVATAAMSRLEDRVFTLLPYGIPWGGAPGNHDRTTGGLAGAPNVKWNRFFGAARWAGKPYFGGTFSPTNNSNNYQLFSASGLDFIIFHLDYSTATAFDPAVLAWVDALMKAHPHRRAIVTSHWILSLAPTSPIGAPAVFGGAGKRFLDEFKDNPNFFLMLCGHIHGEGRRTDEFEGRIIYSVLQDYQGRVNGGDGWLRYFIFSPANNTITAKTYSPKLGIFETDTDATSTPRNQASEFVLSYDMQNAVSGWIPLGTVNVPAGGGAATLPWTGLEANSHYEWYAVVDDGINVPSTATRRFSTVTDAAPAVAITHPAPGATLGAGTTVTITATATDDVAVAKVEFYDGNTLLGTDTDGAPWQFVWSGTAVSAGDHLLSAVALDNANQPTLSELVDVTVDNPPTVAITTPANGAAYFGGSSIAITAEAADSDGTVAKVEFFANGGKLGEDATAPFSFDWNGAPTGNHTLTAVATDSGGFSTTSAPVSVGVLADADADGLPDDYETANGLNPHDPLDGDLDRDGDLLSNRLEYALDLPANAPGRTGLPILGQGTGAHTGKLTFTFTRRRGELTYVVRASDDLKTWTDIATNPGTLGTPVTVVDDNTTSPNRYLRLHVTDGVSSATTIPLGRMTHTLTQNQETSLSFPLHDGIGAMGGQPAGFITAVGAGALDNASAGWTPGQLSSANAPYFVRITGGAAQGRIFPVSTTTANSATRLTLVTGGVNLTTLGIVPGTDTYELFPGETLASLFPAGTIFSGTAATGDNLRFWTGSGWVTFYHDGTAWRRSPTMVADTTLVRPDQGVMWLRRGASTTFTVLGQVPATKASVPVPRRATTLVSLLPVEQTFAEFPLQTLLGGWASNPANPTGGDHVRIWNGTAWLVFYFDGAYWQRQGGGIADTTVLLQPGRPFFVFRPAGSGSDLLIQSKTY